MEMGSNSLGVSGASSGSGDSLHGLSFGEKIYFEDGGGGGGNSSNASLAAPPPPPPAKKGKGAVQGARQPPRCRVEGCMADLSRLKTYYFRHKVCVMHSKAPREMVDGLEQRFCQQCSRFHRLTEFDQGKRSCRRRLAGHNERRRKPPPGPFAPRYGRRMSAFHEEPSRFRSFQMDFSHPRFSSTTRDVWPRFSNTLRDVMPTIRAVDCVATNQCLGVLHPPSVMHGAHPYMQGPSEGPLYAVPELPRGECIADSSCALSLLSTQPWNNNNNNNSTLRNQVSTISASGNNHLASSQYIQHEIGLTGATGVGDGQFTGELELALQGNWQYHVSSRAAYEQSGHIMHWSL